MGRTKLSWHTQNFDQVFGEGVPNIAIFGSISS
jgi:hypothetical protein